MEILSLGKRKEIWYKMVDENVPENKGSERWCQEQLNADKKVLDEKEEVWKGEMDALVAEHAAEMGEVERNYQIELDILRDEIRDLESKLDDAYNRLGER